MGHKFIDIKSFILNVLQVFVQVTLIFFSTFQSVMEYLMCGFYFYLLQSDTRKSKRSIVRKGDANQQRRRASKKKNKFA